MKKGNRVIVNRIDCDVFKRGEMVVFADSLEREYFIGQITGIPGDTIRIQGSHYVIPFVCCKRCGCKDCRYYLVRTSQGKLVVHKHQMLGKAYKLF